MARYIVKVLLRVVDVVNMVNKNSRPEISHQRVGFVELVVFELTDVQE